MSIKSLFTQDTSYPLGHLDLGFVLRDKILSSGNSSGVVYNDPSYKHSYEESYKTRRTVQLGKWLFHNTFSGRMSTLDE